MNTRIYMQHGATDVDLGDSASKAVQAAHHHRCNGGGLPGWPPAIGGRYLYAVLHMTAQVRPMDEPARGCYMHGMDQAA